MTHLAARMKCATLLCEVQKVKTAFVLVFGKHAAVKPSSNGRVQVLSVEPGRFFDFCVFHHRLSDDSQITGCYGPSISEWHGHSENPATPQGQRRSPIRTVVRENCTMRSPGGSTSAVDPPDPRVAAPASAPRTRRRRSRDTRYRIELRSRRAHGRSTGGPHCAINLDLCRVSFFR